MSAIAAPTRPAAFASYAARIAWNLRAHLAPPTAETASLRDFLDDLYADIQADPGAWKLRVDAIRPEDGRDKITAPRAKLEGLLRALYTLGQMATVQPDGAVTVEGDAWRAWLAANKGRTLAPMLARLESLGLALGGEETLTLASARTPGLPAALARLAQAAATAREKGLYHFCMANPRVLAGDVGWTLEDAQRSLEPRDRAALSRMDAYARSLGCRMDLTPPTLWWGEFRARYDHGPTRKALCGFVVQEGALSVRVVAESTLALLPAVLAEPAPVRAWFLETVRCLGCGGCGERGPLKVEVDGQPELLCHWNWGRNARPPYEHMDAIERLIDHVLAAAREKRAAEKAAKQAR